MSDIEYDPINRTYCWRGKYHFDSREEAEEFEKCCLNRSTNASLFGLLGGTLCLLLWLISIRGV